MVITHNRGTIEVADALYGVTVGDDAVSRVISLKLADLPEDDPRLVGKAASGDRAREPGSHTARAHPAPGCPGADAPGLRRTGPQPARLGSARRRDLGGGGGSAHLRRPRRGDRHRGLRPGSGPHRRRSAEGAPAELLDPLRGAQADSAWPRIPGPGIPAVILVVGVNGTGKTTTIAKLAYRFKSLGAKVLLAAADTFRAAAIEQIETWAAAHRRAGRLARCRGRSVGPSSSTPWTRPRRVAWTWSSSIPPVALHTKANLMEELAKIRRTIGKRIPEAQPEVLFVLDATTGQNGLMQAKAFNDSSGLTAIALTKLDSTAKGGVAFAIERTDGRAGALRRPRREGDRPARLRPQRLRGRPLRGGRGDARSSHASRRASVRAKPAGRRST